MNESKESMVEMPNMAVKGTRRPSAVVNLVTFFEFAGFANRRAPYFNVSH